MTMMTAEDAAKTWFKRAQEIEDDYRAKRNLSELHDEASRAALGISALLEARDSEMSERTKVLLRGTVDRLAAIHQGTLDENSPSPILEGLKEGAASVEEDVKHAVERAKHGAKKVADAFDFGKWLKWGAALLGLILAIQIAATFRRL